MAPPSPVEAGICPVRKGADGVGELPLLGDKGRDLFGEGFVSPILKPEGRRRDFLSEPCTGSSVVRKSAGVETQCGAADILGYVCL